jgi:nitrate/nitrite transporter NarK
MENKKTKVHSFRWIVLAMAWFSFFVIAMAWYIMPTLEHELLKIYNISSAQYSTALTIPFLIAGLLSLLGGMLADNIGIKKTASLGSLIAGIGIVLRAGTGGFLSLLLPMMIVGVGMGLIMPNLPKIVSVWFPPEETGLATGIYNTGLMGGLSTGLVIAPFLPSWQLGNYILGSIVIISGILFYLIVKDSPPGKKLPPITILEGLQTALRSKNAWFASLAVMTALAGMVSFQGALPGGLNKVYGIPMSKGGQITSLITYLGILGSLTLPYFANKLKKRKLFIIVLPISFSIIMYLTWIFGSIIIVIWLGTALAGYLAGGALPLLMEVPTFLPRNKKDPVQEQHVGGVSGMLTSFMNIGGFIGLSFIVMPIIINFGYNWGFLVAAILFAIQALFASGIAYPDN